MDLSKLKFDREKASSVIGIAAAACLVYSTLSLVLKKKEHKGLKEIPVPSSCYPYVGHLFSLGSLPSRQIAKWHTECGPIIELRMGAQTWISISNPYLAHELFVQKGAYSSARPVSLYTSLYSHGGRGVIFSNNQQWKTGREAMLSVLAPKMVNQYMENIEFEATDLVKRLMNDTAKNGHVNPTGYLQLTTLNIIFDITIGKRYESLDDPELHEIITMLKRNIYFGGIEKDISTYLPILSVFDRFSGLESTMKDHFVNTRDVIIRKLISQAVQKNEINIMKTLNDEASNLDEMDKVILLSDIMGAGQDSTETSLGWAFAILCNHPEVQTKMQEEIDGFIKINGRSPVFDDRDALPYLLSTIKECLRFRPPTSFGAPHIISKDVEVNGYFIPEGTTVVTTMESLHFNESVYENADKFMPERFLDNTKTMTSSANGRIAERDHYNFGWGRRICPGIYMAEVELFCMFVQLFGRCTIEPIGDSNGNKVYPDLNTMENAGIIVAPGPYQVKFTKRSNSLL